MKFLSKKFHIFIDKADSNKPQRIHIAHTSRAGGVGIFLAFCLIFFAGDYLSLNLYFFIAFTIVFISGLSEDFSASLSPKTRLLIQLLGVCIGIFGVGAVITDLSPIIKLPYFLGIAFSLFGIIGVCNAINIIDGLNGLAGGICIMAFTAIGIAGFIVKADFILLASIIGAGGVMGFIILNFPKGKIFLGDGGAYMLGFILAILLSVLTQKNTYVSTWFGLTIMIYPVWEVLFSIYRRKIKRNLSPMQPDRMHLHMLLHKRVFKNNPLSSAIIWLFNLPFMILGVIFMHRAWVLMGICIVFIIIYMIIYRRLVKFKFF
ncbi:hypothetical protein BKH45_02680 [Helicobacter sp. 11S03491-1]|nr:hypothetical protein BKH45_02680 [Helicobacter sp. 11S03491-1]